MRGFAPAPTVAQALATHRQHALQHRDRLRTAPAIRQRQPQFQLRGREQVAIRQRRRIQPAGHAAHQRVRFGRLAILAQRYRDNWEWSDAVLATATARLGRWSGWAANPVEGGTLELTTVLREAIADDLNTARAIDAIDHAIESGTPASDGDILAIDALLTLYLNVVPGLGPSAGAALGSHADVDVIAGTPAFSPADSTILVGR